MTLTGAGPRSTHLHRPIRIRSLVAGTRIDVQPTTALLPLPTRQPGRTYAKQEGTLISQTEQAGNSVWSRTDSPVCSKVHPLKLCIDSVRLQSRKVRI